MDQEKIGKLIKDLRNKSKMTQAEFAEKYGVSYQAVSKWENGKNLPDTLILKEICKDYSINIDDILNGEISHKKRKNKQFLIAFILLLIFIGEVLYFHYKSNNTQPFEFRTISANCDNFKVNGSIAYNKNKSSLYISKIEYCGKNPKEIYKKINCSLYEKSGNLETKISSCTINDNHNLTLEEYLKNVSINTDNYNSICNDYTNDSLYLVINATNKNDEDIIFNIPLSIKSCA